MQYCCRKVSAHPFVFATVRTFFSWYKLFKIITYATDKQQIRTMETLFPRYIAPNVGTSLTSFLSLDLRERRYLQCDWVRDTYTITDTVSWKISTCHLWKKCYLNCSYQGYFFSLCTLIATTERLPPWLSSSFTECICRFPMTSFLFTSYIHCFKH